MRRAFYTYHPKLSQPLLRVSIKQKSAAYPKKGLPSRLRITIRENAAYPPKLIGGTSPRNLTNIAYYL